MTSGNLAKYAVMFQFAFAFLGSLDETPLFCIFVRQLAIRFTELFQLTCFAFQFLGKLSNDICIAVKKLVIAGTSPRSLFS